MGSPGASEELQKNVQKGGLLGDSRAEINAQRDALVAESSQRFDTKHFRGRVSGSSDGQMTAPHGGDSKSTLTPAGIDYDGTP